MCVCVCVCVGGGGVWGGCVCVCVCVQRMSSILLQCRLHFLGHLSRIPEDWLPRQLLMCAPVGGKHSAGGQKQRQNEVVASDFKQCNLSGTWS